MPRFLVGIALAVTLTIFPLLAGTARAQETTIRAAHFIASPHSGFRSVFNTWLERVNAEGKDLVRVPQVVSEESIPGTQMATALRNGVIDMAAVPPSYYYNVVPEGETTVLSEISPAEQRKKGSLDILDGEMKVVRLNPQDSQQYLKMAYDAHWDEIAKVTPENTKKLSALTSK
ncbi:MAG: hypothetical protein EXR27_01205 [Betaproteobacteria bacterium]|nr:hypothetical protein [Betaproteobacteria bacterium]